MPTFGFSAFLKLLSLNDRPQRTALRNRLTPRGEGGYDFHRSMRLRAQRFLVAAEEIETVLASCGEITAAAEQRSARAALEHLRDWRRDHPGPTIGFAPRTFESPEGEFKVHFTPDFGLMIDGRLTAVHVWNTAHPPLAARMVYAALSLFPALYAGDPRAPEDLAVLSLREPRLYRLSDAPVDHRVLAQRTVALIDRTIGDIRDDLGLPPPPPAPPHPPGP